MEVSSLVINFSKHAHVPVIEMQPDKRDSENTISSLACQSLQHSSTLTYATLGFLVTPYYFVTHRLRSACMCLFNSRSGIDGIRFVCQQAVERHEQYPNYARRMFQNYQARATATLGHRGGVANS